MTKAKINLKDAVALLSQTGLYPNQLQDVLVKELHAIDILCLSDTTDVLLKDHQTKSIAHAIEKAGLGPEINIIQSDFVDFRYLKDGEYKKESAPKFGAHLPQQEFESRREYAKIDSRQLKQDLTDENVDVVLGRSCICACSGNGKLCGGIDISSESQQAYLQTLIDKGPSFIALSASRRIFKEDAKGQTEYILAKKNLMSAITNLQQSGPYKFVFVEATSDDKRPDIEGGYLLVAYDPQKVNFQISDESLQKQREQKSASESSLKKSTEALIEQRQSGLKKQSPAPDESPPSSPKKGS